jgi:hypothetical protein
MLLQLSEWQLAATSLSITSTTKRRRSRKGSFSQNDGNDGHVSTLPVAVAFVPPGRRNRPSKRRKGDPAADDVTPIVAVTTSHGIIVLGKPQSQSGEGGEAPKFRESTRLQYSSRPGKQSSFLHESVSPSEDSLPCIPALLDGKNDRVYALQGQNTNVVSWNAVGEGPDDTSAKVARFTLPKPAMSMNILSGNKGIIYGTLRDNRFYIGVWTSDGASLKSYTFDSPNAGDGHHVCTAMTQVKSDNRGKNGSKRKATEPDNDFVLTQLFANKHGFLVVKHQLQVANDSVEVRDTETSLSRVEVVSKVNVSIDTNQILHSRDGESIALLYQEVTRKEIINGKKQQTETREHKACHISLADGLLKGEPFEIPSSTRHVGFVSDNLLAVGTIDSILLYEVERGVLVRSINVSDIVSDTKDWSLTTDSDKSSLTILSAQPNAIHVAIATVASKTPDSQGQDFDLADGLRASMISNAHLIVPNEVPPTKNLLDFLSSPSKDDDACMQVGPGSSAVPDALASLSACLERILDPKDEPIKANVLLDMYENALAKVLPSSWSPTKRNGAKQGRNGIHKENSKRVFENEILSSRGETPSTTPQEFVDGATTLVLATLQLPRTESKIVGIKIKIARLDARLILYRLIRSGKVSARRHFQMFSDDDSDPDVFLSVLRATKLTNKRGRRVISPVDLMHEMLSSCPDLTERQLVTMIHYMLCKALPHDIAENCLGWKCFEAGHPYTQLSKNFFQAKSAEYKLQLQHPKDGDEKMKQLQQTIEELSAKLLKVGLTFLVERIVTYSKLNESLLRTALAEGLVNRSESPSLARVLLDILGKTNRLSGRELHLATTKWIFVLCEACRDTLSAAGSSEAKSHLAFILERLQRNVEDNTHIMSLGPTLESMRGLRHDSDVHSSEKKTEVDIPKKETRPTKLAGYCIEHLIL